MNIRLAALMRTASLPEVTSVRAINRARIISLIRRHPGIIRADLARLSGLSRATVSALVDEIIAKGFLYEDSEHGARQRRVGLYVNRDAGAAVGLDFRPGECRGIVTDLSMRTLGHCVRSLFTNTAPEIIDALVDVYHHLLGHMDSPCLGVVVAAPGPTDSSGQNLMFSPNMGWGEVPLGPDLSARLHQHVSVVNVPVAMTLGECWQGAGVGVQNMIHLNLSSGIGAGIVVDGQLLAGAHGFSAEVGHTIVLPDGPPCGCGNHGCLEAVASLPVIVEQAQLRAEGAGLPATGWRCGDPNDPTCHRDFIDAARDGNPFALDAIRQASQYLGIVVANLVNIFNPNLVVLGGPLAELGEILINAVRETAERRSLSLCYSGVNIVRGKLGADAACVGACGIVINRYVADVEPAMRASLF